jgi:hypothetical protein
MDEASRKKSATAAFISRHPDCCFCAGLRPAVTREHMPPKALFDGKHRPDKLVMPSCDSCNRGTSTADLVVSIVSRWGETPSNSDHASLVARLRKQAPEIVAEWTTFSLKQRIMGRRHLEAHGVSVPPGAGVVSLGLRSVQELNLFAHKATLALYFERFRRPLPLTGAFCAYWRSKEDYARNGVPNALLDLLPKYDTLVQGRWNTSEIFEYRYDFNDQEGLIGFIARLRTGMFISGFAVKDASLINNDDTDWLAAGDLLALMQTDRFKEKR